MLIYSTFFVFHDMLNLSDSHIKHKRGWSTAQAMTGTISKSDNVMQKTGLILIGAPNYSFLAPRLLFSQTKRAVTWPRALKEYS